MDSSSTADPKVPAVFAVVDLETTGLEPTTDRIVECAVLGLDEHGAVLDEWETVVAIPCDGQVGASFLHGLTPEKLDGAPSFATVLGTLVSHLQGRVIVGHVLSFDVAFLTAESARVGYALPDLLPAGICTRELARTHLTGESYSLSACCYRAGVSHKCAHTALGDARATAGLLARLIARATIDPSRELSTAKRLVWDVPPPARHAARPRSLGGSSAGSTLALS